MKKATIVRVGTVDWTPDDIGRAPTLSDWRFEGGDYPGLDATTGLIGGWTVAELEAIAASGDKRGT